MNQLIHQLGTNQPPLQHTPLRYLVDLHCSYHQRAGHDTDSCAVLRHAIQDLIDQGLVDLGRPGVTIGPLPTHETRVVPSPLRGVHLIEFAGDEIFMMGWNGEKPQPIHLYVDSNFNRYIFDQQIPKSFRLTPNGTLRQLLVPPRYLQHAPPMTHHLLFPKDYGPTCRDFQTVTQSRRVAQPLPIDRPFAGVATREDNEILRQLRTIQACISIWSLLAQYVQRCISQSSQPNQD